MRISGELLEAIDHYLNGTATSEENQLVNNWYHSFDDSEVIIHTEEQNLKNKIDALIRTRLAETTCVSAIAEIPAAPIRRKLFNSWAAAAAILLVCGTVLYFSLVKNTSSSNERFANDVTAGKNIAVLTLANGQKIVLSDSLNGQLAKQSGISISKTEDGQLVYTVIDEEGNASGQPEMNTIETPKGGKYIVNLPDGTKIWLNAASQLTFPAQFTGNERRVELSGEAYFEVAKVMNKNTSERTAFVVKTDKQEVEVLGTHFNINSYADENAVKTTLLEGSVKVLSLVSQDTQLLKPGQQSILETGALKVRPADIAVEMAWKNGEFIFASNDFRSEMRKVARWYDVEVVYDESVPKDFELGGFISREKNLSAVLKLIELTGNVHFKIEGRRVLVTK